MTAPGVSLAKMGQVNTGEQLAQETTRRALGVASIIVVYLSLNSGMNLMIKWALGVKGFRFPFILTTFHMLISFLVLAPVAMCQPWQAHRQTLVKQWKGVVFIGIFLSGNIALNNISLQDISLSLNQIIRSAIPVVTCTLAIWVESKWPTRKEVVSLVTLMFGVMLAVWQGTVTGKPYAIASCIAATLANGAMMTFSGKLMSEKLDVVRLTFYTAPVGLACLAPFCVLYEAQRFGEYVGDPYNFQLTLIVMLGSSVVAVCYNLVHNLMIQKTSATTTTVLGEVKIIGLLILSAILFDEHKDFTLKMTVGCLLALLGFGMYSYTKILKFRESVELEVVGSREESKSDISAEMRPLKGEAQA